MATKSLGIGLLSVGCLMAASAGGYFALRQDTPTPEVPVEAIAPGAAEAAPDPFEAPTVETSAATQDVVNESRPEDSAPESARTPGQTAAARTPSRPDPKPVVPALPAPTPPELLPASAESEVPLATAPAQAPAPPPDTAPQRYVPDVPLPPTGATQVAEPQRAHFEELIVDKHSVIGIRLDEAITTKTARVEDRVTATVSRDVTVAGHTAIPAGVRLEGIVVLVERGGQFKDKAKLGLRFDRMILADGTRLSISTDTIMREGDSPAADATAKIGAGAVAGAILGAVLGGKKGAAIGTAAGAAGGAAVVIKGDQGEVQLPAGAPLTVRLNEDIAIIVR